MHKRRPKKPDQTGTNRLSGMANSKKNIGGEGYTGDRKRGQDYTEVKGKTGGLSLRGGTLLPKINETVKKGCVKNSKNHSRDKDREVHGQKKREV